MKKIPELLFPASVACAASYFAAVRLHKWVRGFEVSEPLDLDAERGRERDRAPGRFTFADVVRLHLLTNLRQDFGILADAAVRMTNAAFEEISSGIVAAVQGIESQGYVWEEMEGPWLVIAPKSSRFEVSLVMNESELNQIGYASRFNSALIFDLRHMAQQVMISLSRPSLANEVQALRAKQSDAAGDE